jgi:hypothetical protein
MKADPIDELLVALDVPTELHADAVPLVAEALAKWLEARALTIPAAYVRQHMKVNPESKP